MDKKRKDELEAALEVAPKMVKFFKEGGTMGDLMDVSDETLENLYAFAHHLYQNNKYLESEKAFAFLTVCNHLEKKYLVGLGAARQMQKRYKEALEAYAMAIILDLRDPEIHLYIGDCLLALGNKSDAEKSYRTVIEFAGTKEKYKDIKRRAKGLMEILEQAETEKNQKKGA